jgi:subtilisin family serine protease
MKYYFFLNGDLYSSSAVYNRNCQLKKQSKKIFDTEGHKIDHKTFNRGTDTDKYKYEVLPLEQIYTECRLPNGSVLQTVQDFIKGIQPVLVTIYDSGVNYNHPSLAYKIPRIGGRTKGWNPTTDDEPYDPVSPKEGLYRVGHGTHVAGIAAHGSDEIELLPLKYRRERPFDAIKRAYEAGSRIINISAGSEDKSVYAWAEMLAVIANRQDVLFVVAAGNEHSDLDQVHSAYRGVDLPNLLVVASVGKNHRLSSFSNWGKQNVHVAAPGEDVSSFLYGNVEDVASGTSVATPYVTNIAAKIMAINPQLSPEEICKIIRETADKTSELQEKTQFGGVINEEKALSKARATINH